MSQRNSEYTRADLDRYITPAWCTLAVIRHLGVSGNVRIWEPAAGTGAMVDALRTQPGFSVIGTDVSPTGGFLQKDFLTVEPDEWSQQFGLLVTNPPFNLATEFIEQALRLTAPQRGIVAMLTRSDFDHARSRRHLFADNPAWAKRVVLHRRIVWFVDEVTGKPKASPSVNHVWNIWSHRHDGPATIAYSE
jgi:hypothetical protein